MKSYELLSKLKFLVCACARARALSSPAYGMKGLCSLCSWFYYKLTFTLVLYKLLMVLMDGSAGSETVAGKCCYVNMHSLDWNKENC
jgi:hypothetical protein